METLKNLMDDELRTLRELGLITKKRQLTDFITNDNKSAEFINSVVGEESVSVPDKGNPLYSVAIGRARHSAISFLMGLVFKEFSGLYKEIAAILPSTGMSDDLISLRLWLMTALNHDRAYSSTRLTNPELNYQSKFTYYLFDRHYEKPELSCLNEFEIDYPRVLAYTYEEILKYDEYARFFHTKNYKDNKGEIERVDHGILGGVILFDSAIKKYMKKGFTNSAEMRIIKASALTISQHNIFKSSKPENDILYGEALKKLHHNSDFVISYKYPLLLLLSLVDTVECVKRFSQGENPDSDPVQTLTVLNYILADVTDKYIYLDFSKLREHIEKNRKGLLEKYISHLRSIATFKTWTALEAELDGDTIKIALQSNTERAVDMLTA